MPPPTLRERIKQILHDENPPLSQFDVRGTLHRIMAAVEADNVVRFGERAAPIREPALPVEPDGSGPLARLQTVAVELAYEDALRLWVLVHDPARAGEHPADNRIRKIVNDAIKVTEDAYEQSEAQR